MTKRNVVAMTLEKQEEAGKVSYGKRKRTLEKKAQDLSTLCGISVCTLCFDSNGNVDTWPRDPDVVRGILERYTAKRDAKQIWELTETETAPASATNQNQNQNQNLDEDKTKEKEKEKEKKKKKKKDDEKDEEKNQNHNLEKDNGNEKEEEGGYKEKEEKKVTVNHKQVREDKVERRRSTLKRWQTWGSGLGEREDLSQESLMTIAKALDYKLQIANGMIGLKEMIKRRKLGIRIGDSASTSISCSTGCEKHKGISHGIYSSSSGTTSVGDGSSSSHDPDNNNYSNLVLGDRNHDLYSNFAASRPPQFFQFF